MFAATMLLAVGTAGAQEADTTFGGHVKSRLLGQLFPSDSLFDALTGSSALDAEADLRLNFGVSRGPWSFDAAYQLFAGYGDRIEYSRMFPDDAQLLFDRLPNDRRRLMDLTHVIRDQGKFAALHRLDRLWVGYAGEKTVVRVGRQAISWGNGFFFAPMDFVNPFDPAAIDTEYKPGDDMVYAQYLRDNGDDVQAAVVFRRDAVTGDHESDEGTVTIKYHGFADNAEFDFLLADNFGNLTVGFGGNRNIGGAVLRGDVVVTDAESGTKVQVVANLSHSWMWGERNVTGVLEYFFNGWGQKGGQYSPQDLAQNPELVQRVARGETSSLGRNYLAGGLTIEMTPLWQLLPNLFVNVADPSALMQFVSQHSLGDNAVFLGAVNVPLGANGTEYGGVGTGTDGVYFSTDASLFAQFAWYF